MPRPKTPEHRKRVKLTVSIEPKVKKAIAKRAQQQDKSMSAYINDTNQP